MAIVNVEDVAGVRDNLQTICIHCWTGNMRDLELDAIISTSELEGDDIYFCDICKKAI